MKLYCVDIGNTRTHCAVVEAAHGQLRVLDSTDYKSGDFAELFAKQRLFETSGASVVSWCSVVPAYSAAFKAVLGEVDAFQLTCKTSPMEIDIRAPEQLGQDRIADAVGAGHFLKPPYIVVDMGTAVTIDLVDARGRYAGGAIAPGMNAFASYLGERAAQLPSINPADADCSLCIGKDTVEAMYVGCAKGFCKLVDGIISDIADEYFGGEDVAQKTVFTGGSVALLPQKWLGGRLVNANLAHLGLAMAFMKNRF